MKTWRMFLISGLAVFALLLLFPGRSGVEARTPGIRALPIRPRNVFLDNGSLQPGLPGAVSTLPLFLRNGGHFGFGSGGFQQFTLSNPRSVIIPPGMSGMGGKAGGLNGADGGGY
jgi:hypothetical protein